MANVILHIDLNAFFASAEVARDPSLKGLPLVIAHDNNKSIISTASYEARKFGIHSAQPVHIAKRLCPNLVFRDPDFRLYSKISNDFIEFIKKNYSQKVEVTSIDECFVDITDNLVHYQGSVIEFIKKIQKEIYQEIKIGCSIGVAPNKFLAKMASDMKKPFGITILRKRDVAKKLWPLDIEKMYGIGKKTAPKLKEIGIKNISDLANYQNIIKLKTIFGRWYEHYQDLAKGIDKSKVISEQDDPKSIGNSSTLLQNTDDLQTLNNLLMDLSCNVSRRAKSSNLKGNTIKITVKYFDFTVKNKQKKMEKYTNEEDIIYAMSVALFESMFDNKSIRLLGVTLGNITPSSNIITQLDIFTYQKYNQDSKNENRN